MRVLLIGLFCVVASFSAASAQTLVGMTTMHYDAGHGTQVEYIDRNGKSYLWYPGNRIILMAPWRQTLNSMCYRYGPDTYNPITRQPGGKWKCIQLRLIRRGIVDQAAGDVFGLARKTSVPFVLPRTKTSIEKLLRRSGR